MSRTPFSCLQEKVQENRGVSGLAFLPCGHGSVLAGVRSIRFDQGPRPAFLLHLLQSFAHVQLLRVCRHRRASVGGGRPPHPGPGPWIGWLARFVARGCGGVAHLGCSWPGFGPVWPRAAARAVTHFGPYLSGVAIASGPGHEQVSAICKTAAAERILPDLVRLYW